MQTNSMLNQALSPIQAVLDSDDVSEIMINGPAEVFIEQRGLMHKTDIDYPRDKLDQLGRFIAKVNHQTFDVAHPLLSGNLPGGERVQLVRSPCTLDQRLVVAIRKQTLAQLDFETLVQHGSLSHVVPVSGGVCHENDQLKYYYDQQNFPEFVKRAVQLKKNILISGGTSSGKTTFARALGTLIDPKARLLTIEDAHEMSFDLDNVVHLLATKGDQGQAKVSIMDLLEASLRLRPDRIFVSELRGAEAFAYLRAINSGHPGSITTLHANDPVGAKAQLVMMANQANHGLDEQSLRRYIDSAIDVIIQCAHTETGRRVTHIEFQDRTHEEQGDA